MLTHLFTAINKEAWLAIGLTVAFWINVILIANCSKFMPHDQGRQFAHEGAISAGKPRGLGLIFVLVFAACTFLFMPGISLEITIYLVLIILEMLTGFFDDAAEKPWGELIKGLLDLAIAIAVAVTYIYYNGSTLTFAFIGTSLKLPPVVFGILTVILVWAAINVTNCTDGVDGLSATLTIISLVSFIIYGNYSDHGQFNYCSMIFITVLLGYLWFNSTPSLLLMGDAGSRAEGMIIALAALKSGSPLLYLLFAIVFIVDGGLGLVKVSLIRVLKIHILKNTTTPIHDHVRKKIGWSNAQCVYRFAIIQLFISIDALFIIMSLT